MKYILRIAVTLCALLLVGQGCLSLSGSSDNVTSGPAGMFVSTDRGESWKAISVLPEADGVKNINTASVYRLANDPQDTGALYWASRGQGMFYSYNSGVNWMRATEPLKSGFIYSVAVHPTDKCTIYASNGKQVFRSVDCNRSWTEVYRESNNDRVNSIAISSFAPYQMYILKNQGDILRSEDQGVSWRVIRRLRTRALDIFTDPHEAGRLYAGTQSKGMWRSEDSGDTWFQIDTPFDKLTKGLEYRRFYIHPKKPGLLLYASTYGIHRSFDFGVNWERLNLIHPPGSAKIFGLTINPSNINELYYTATIDQRSTLYNSIDGGNTWITKRLPSAQVPTVLQGHKDNAEWLYVGFTIPPKS